MLQGYMDLQYQQERLYILTALSSPPVQYSIQLLHIQIIWSTPGIHFVKAHCLDQIVRLPLQNQPEQEYIIKFVLMMSQHAIHQELGNTTQLVHGPQHQISPLTEIPLPS